MSAVIDVGPSRLHRQRPVDRPHWLDLVKSKRGNDLEEPTQWADGIRAGCPPDNERTASLEPKRTTSTDSMDAVDSKTQSMSADSEAAQFGQRRDKKVGFDVAASMRHPQRHCGGLHRQRLFNTNRIG